MHELSNVGLFVGGINNTTLKNTRDLRKKFFNTNKENIPDIGWYSLNFRREESDVSIISNAFGFAGGTIRRLIPFKDINKFDTFYLMDDTGYKLGICGDLIKRGLPGYWWERG